MIIETLTLILAFCVFYYIAFSFFRDFFLGRRKNQFKCTQCGRCCKHYNVTVTQIDIKRIERRGYKKSDFMNGTKLKRLGDGSCIFLGKSKNRHFCKIHKFRPNVCGSWPFDEYLCGRWVMARNFPCPALKNIRANKN